MGYIHLAKLPKGMLPTHLPLTSVSLCVLYPCEITQALKDGPGTYGG